MALSSTYAPLSPILQVALTADITLAIPPGTPTSVPLTIVFTQDAVGGRTVAFPPSVVMASGASWDLTTAPNGESTAVFRHSAALGWVCEGCWGSYVPTLAGAILDLNPVGYWKLTETTGTTAADSSGNGRDGTYSGAYALAGRNGFLSLTNGVVTIPDNDAFSVAGSNGFSVFALYQPAAGGGGAPRTIVSKMNAGALEWNLQHRAAVTIGNSTVFTATGSNYMDEREVTGTLTDGVWHAIAVAMPAPAMGAKMVHYTDSGTASPTTTGTVSATAPANGAAPLRIGNRGDVATSPMVGALGHVAIFRSKLTAAQVDRLVTLARSEGLIP